MLECAISLAILSMLLPALQHAIAQSVATSRWLTNQESMLYQAVNHAQLASQYLPSANNVALCSVDAGGRPMLYLCASNVD